MSVLSHPRLEPGIRRYLRKRQESDHRSARPSVSGTARLATWAFVVPTLIGYLKPPGGDNISLKVGSTSLVLMLALIGRELVAGTVARRHCVVVVGTVVTAVALIAGYAFAWPWLAGPSAAPPSMTMGVLAALSATIAVAYARFFYDERLLLDVFWRVVVAVTILALVAYAADAVTGDGWMVHQHYGTPRLQGLMNEPSAWAPVLPALLLMALHRQSVRVVALSAVAIVLAKSPTVLLATVLTLTVYVLLSPRCRRWRKELVLLLAACWVGAWHWIGVLFDSDQRNAGWFGQVTGRLAGGVANVTSGGQAGRNDRFAAVQALLVDLRQHGWLLAGIGPGFQGHFQQETGMLAYSLPAYMLGAFGLVGVATLAVALVWTVWRLRGRPTFALFLPFIVAALINSAGGWESYKFTVAAVAAVPLVRGSWAARVAHSSSQNSA